MDNYRIVKASDRKWLVQELKPFLWFKRWVTVKTFKTLAGAHCYAFPYSIGTAIYGYWD